MEYSAAEIQNRVLTLVRNILVENAIQANVEPTSNLTDIGLTSTDMVALMLRVEAEFDITIPQVAITFENFRSVESLKRMIFEQWCLQARRWSGAGS